MRKRDVAVVRSRRGRSTVAREIAATLADSCEEVSLLDLGEGVYCVEFRPQDRSAAVAGRNPGLDRLGCAKAMLAGCDSSLLDLGEGLFHLELYTARARTAAAPL